MRSTWARSEERIIGPAVVPPPVTYTRPQERASRSAALRQRKNRGASWMSTRSGAQARMTRVSAARSSRNERML